jgi:hypothetical protein
LTRATAAASHPSDQKFSQEKQEPAGPFRVEIPHNGRGEGTFPMKIRGITRADILTIIEEVGFGKAVIGGADEKGIVIDGYLDLTTLAERLNRLYELRNRTHQLVDSEQAR